MSQMTPGHTAAGSATYPHKGDLDLIPFEQGAGPNEGSFELTSNLTRQDGILYGGTGAATTVIAMETATQRDAIWVLTQFVAPVRVGERISWVVGVLAQGRYVAQLQLTATVDDRVVFCGLGATGRDRANGLTGQFDVMPQVEPPEKCEQMRRGRSGHHANMELREAPLEPGRPPGHLALWARLTTGADLTRAGMAFLVDRVPLAISRAAGVMALGLSLDNCLRFAATPQTEWILLELHGQVASHGYGHGSLTVWAPDGTLLATGSQSATMTRIPDPIPHTAPSSASGDGQTAVTPDDSGRRARAVR